MKCSLALCVHAFIPSFFENYASNELNVDGNDMEEDDVIAYIDLGDQLSQDVEYLKDLKGKKNA